MNIARIYASIVPVLPDLTQTIMALALGARLSPCPCSGLRAQFGLITQICASYDEVSRALLAAVFPEIERAWQLKEALPRQGFG